MVPPPPPAAAVPLRIDRLREVAIMTFTVVNLELVRDHPRNTIY